MSQRDLSVNMKLNIILTLRSPLFYSPGHRW